jgi:putative transposase
VVTPNQQRAAADYLIKKHGVGQRHVARLLEIPRSTLRYCPRPRPKDEAALIRAIRQLAKRHPRYGYKRIHARLGRQGWTVNRKRVRRLWIALGLKRPSRPIKPKKKGRLPGSGANSCVNRPAQFKNHVWTYDFIMDRTVNGSSLKWLSLVDEYTRECLALFAGKSLTGTDVRRVLARVIGQRGAPRWIRSDNGSEFICEVLRSWLPQVGAHAIQVTPGSPWQNGYIESFHSRLRDEFLEREEFESVADARAKGGWWRREYNTIRPHSSLGYKTPNEFSKECDRGLHDEEPQIACANASTSVNGTPILGGPKKG